MRCAMSWPGKMRDAGDVFSFARGNRSMKRGSIWRGHSMSPMICRRLLSTSLIHLPKRVIQGRHGKAVVALYVKALAAVGHGADQDCLPGAIVVARIALGGLGVVVVVE